MNVAPVVFAAALTLPLLPAGVCWFGILWADGGEGEAS
jgi:hypothetical protein